jgi:hypothetical protein
LFGRPKTSAGFAAVRSRTRSKVSGPRRASASSSGSAVSTPGTPLGALQTSVSFSSRVWGAWSVAIMSTGPSTTRL